MREAQRSVGRNRPLSVQDAGHAIRRHADLARQLCRGDTELLQFLGKMLAGVDGCPAQRVLPVQ